MSPYGAKNPGYFQKMLRVQSDHIEQCMTARLEGYEKLYTEVASY